MKSIDGVNLVRVRTSIPVVGSPKQKESIDIRSAGVVSDPTILSTLDKNARLVFYSSIQPTATKIPSGRIKRVRSNKAKAVISESLDQRISKLLQTETVSHNDISINQDVNPDTNTLSLFNYSPENQQMTEPDKVRSTAQRAKRISQRAGEFVSKSTNQITYKSDSIRSTMAKFVKTIDHELNNS